MISNGAFTNGDERPGSALRGRCWCETAFRSRPELGTPAHRRDDSQCRQVEALAGYGISEADIAGVVGVDPKPCASYGKVQFPSDRYIFEICERDAPKLVSKHKLGESSSMTRLACDVGGTFTDLIVARGEEIRLYKSPTTPSDPVEGVLAAVRLAAQDLGISDAELLGEATAFNHATTRAINAILTGQTARTAFLTTAGHRDILLLREGGRLDPYDNRREFPRPYVPRALTFEVPERIGAAGEIIQPLDEAAVRVILDQVAEVQAEAIGVCLLWSIANPVHERQLGALIEEVLPGVPFTLSHRLNPILREYRRASSTCIDASLKPLMTRYLGSLADRLEDAGFAGRLLMVTSQGGVIGAEEAAGAPIHALNSGPSMAPVIGRRLAARDADAADAIVADTGGTSFDVSLVRDGRIPWTSETWLGARFSGHMTGFPSVDVTSIGAGGGSVVSVDHAGLLHVGPKSAGADPGPVAYARGGDRPTVTDCALALGWLDPAKFLGGRMALDVDAARQAIARDVAGPLGVGVEEAAHAALDLLTQNMIGTIEEITVKQGVDPTRTVLVAGGGAAGFNGAAIGSRLGAVATLFPSVGAALSAAGALFSDLVFSDARIGYHRSDTPADGEIDDIVKSLAASAARFLAGPAEGRSARIDYWVEARYPQQTWEIEVPFAPPRDGSLNLAQLAADFHEAHQALYAVADPESPVEFIAWRVRVSAGLSADLERDLVAAKDRSDATRRIWLAGTGWSEVSLHAFETVPAMEAVIGPAVIESDFTTVVLPAGSSARRLPSGTIEVRS